MDRLLVATRKGLFAVEGDTPRCIGFLGDPVTMVLSDRRDGTIYAAVGHGHFGAKLHASTDGGVTWSERAAPVYPPKPEGLVDLDPMRNTPRSWSLDQIWSLEAGGLDEPGALWCGTIPGGLFRSEDRGASWRIVESLWHSPSRMEWFGGGYDDPGIHSVVVDPRDSRRVAIAVSCGGVWITEDGGATWAPRTRGMYAAFMPPERREDPVIQDPHRVVQCAGAPDHLWAQHHNGVFRSVDGGATWQEIRVPPSSFGFAVAVHPREPGTAWFVPAIKDQQRVPVDGEFAVARTRDGGSSFEVLRNGLPPAPAYDLVYRHGLDVAEDGVSLAMGSTTGNLWVSGDQGDHWRALSNHLPPIFCVRFA